MTRSSGEREFPRLTLKLDKISEDDHTPSPFTPLPTTPPSDYSTLGYGPHPRQFFRRNSSFSSVTSSAASDEEADEAESHFTKEEEDVLTNAYDIYSTHYQAHKTPFSGLPPSQLVYAISRAVSHSQIEWRHTGKATRAKILGIAKERLEKQARGPCNGSNQRASHVRRTSDDYRPVSRPRLAALAELGARLHRTARTAPYPRLTRKERHESKAHGSHRRPSLKRAQSSSPYLTTPLSLSSSLIAPSSPNTMVSQPQLEAAYPTPPTSTSMVRSFSDINGSTAHPSFDRDKVKADWSTPSYTGRSLSLVPSPDIKPARPNHSTHQLASPISMDSIVSTPLMPSWSGGPSNHTSVLDDIGFSQSTPTNTTRRSMYRGNRR